jgi:arabinogalactan oligomer/maltooligosaccharide transport system substrate-binding protein
MDLRSSAGLLLRRAAAPLFGLAALALLAACSPAPARVPPTPSPSATPQVLQPTPPITATGPITLTLWEEDNDAADVLLDELAADFMRENPGIVITRTHFTYDELRNQFRAESLFDGKPPDLVRSPGEFTGPFGELKIVQPADELFPPALLETFLPGALDGARLKGKVWGLPDNFGGHLMLLYNKSLVTEAPTNTDAWIAQLKTLTDPANGRYGLVFNETESYWLIPWLSGFGGWPLDTAEMPALDTAEMVEALWFLHDLKHQHQVTPEKMDYAGAFEAFAQGAAAYAIDGVWNFERYKGLGVDLGVAMLPRVSKTQLLPAPMGTGRYWFIARGVEGAKLDAAKRFVEYVTSAPAQQDWLARMQRLPSNKQVLGSKLITEDPNMQAVADQLRVARGVPPALEMACAWRGLDAYFGKVMANEVNPDDAPPLMQEEADACVADMAPETPTPEATPTP